MMVGSRLQYVRLAVRHDPVAGRLVRLRGTERQCGVSVGQSHCRDVRVESGVRVQRVVCGMKMSRRVEGVVVCRMR